MEYEPVIGMEVHAELLTESKMFCSCSADFGGAPNSRTCPVCLGLPGALPVPNRKAVEFVVRTALALNCSISENSIFHRKNYFYPDLPKNYQISQYDFPLGLGGWIDITVNGEVKRIGITRVHLEEDTGKLIHTESSDNESLLDYNRSGLPLMEIVSEPDIRNADEAREYLVKLRAILTYLKVNDGKMEEGSLRCEPNISIRPVGQEKFGTKTELKNLNSYRAVYRGVDYEIKRQTEVLNEGGRIIQETRRWDDARGITASMRSKEVEQEYRYFPDPDLIPMCLSSDFVEEQRSKLPELPDAKLNRFIKEYGIPEYDAAILTDSTDFAQFFEDAVDAGGDPKTVSNWMMGDLTKQLNSTGIDITSVKMLPAHIAEMLALMDKGTISGKMAKSVFEEMFQTGKSPSEIVKEKGMTQITDQSEILGVVDRIIEENPKIVSDILGGKDKSMGFLVGQVMKQTQGRANPQLVNELLQKRIDEQKIETGS